MPSSKPPLEEHLEKLEKGETPVDGILNALDCAGESEEDLRRVREGIREWARLRVEKTMARLAAEEPGSQTHQLFSIQLEEYQRFLAALDANEPARLAFFGESKSTSYLQVPRTPEENVPKFIFGDDTPARPPNPSKK